MLRLYLQIVGMARNKWVAPSPGHAATFTGMPLDIFLNICEWLSIRDILALRMTSKYIAELTLRSNIWSSLLRRLSIPLPVFPATSRYHFGEIDPKSYEWLITRAIHLEHNWRSPQPVASWSHFEAFDRTVAMKILPGGKYLVSVSNNLQTKNYSLVVWDLDHAGSRVALASASSKAPFLQMEVKYAMIQGKSHIVIAYAKPPIETAKRTLSTQIQVICVPILALEELTSRSDEVRLFQSCTEVLKFPFQVLHESWTSSDTGQLALGEIDNQLVLLVVHRPRVLVFHYIETSQQGSLLLGPAQPYDAYQHAIWNVKFLPYQNSVLVGRVLIEDGNPLDSMFFSLDMFAVPACGDSLKNPAVIGRQFLSGIRVDSFNFSDLETSWFSGQHDRRGLLPTPTNRVPPPISIFLTTKQPRGFVQFLLHPKQVLDGPSGPYGRQQYVYQLPALTIEKDKWNDNDARPVVIPGAYRSIVWMRPSMKQLSQKQSSIAESGVEVLRVLTYAMTTKEYSTFATPRSTGHITVKQGMGGEIIEVEEQVPSFSHENDENRKPIRSLRVPAIPEDIAWDMTEGTTAMAFDESVGKMCISTVADTRIHVLDFAETQGLAVMQA